MRRHGAALISTGGDRVHGKEVSRDQAFCRAGSTRIVCWLNQPTEATSKPFPSWCGLNVASSPSVCAGRGYYGLGGSSTLLRVLISGSELVN